MLPLWIIDITSNPDRRGEFVKLLGQIEHVHISETYAASSEKLSPAADKSEPAAASIAEEQDNSAQSSNLGSVQEDPSKSKSQQELLEEWEKMTAEKNDIIKGDYWYYSAFDDVFSGLEKIESEKLKEKGNVADLLYDFQSDLVKTGQQFVRQLRLSNAKPYQAINVLVIGDSTESFTRAIFPSIAAMLQKEKERILQAHIHQGICIYGALYIPCDINSRDVQLRNKVLRLFNEIEVQHNLRFVRGYDHVMLYQNVQNRTECTYALMNDTDLAQYLLQCVIHLFYACDNTHPLLSGTRSADMLYFSMGATSIYFDMQAEDANDASRLAAELMKNIRKDREEEEATDREEIYILKHEEFAAEKFIEDINKGMNVDIQDAEMEEPTPHPVLNYMQKNLKRLYYFYYLKFFPAKLLRKISDNIERSTSDLLDKISRRSTHMYDNCEGAIPAAIARAISKVLPEEGVIATIDREFEKLEERLSLEKEHIREELEHHFWDVLLDPERPMIPNNQKDYFETYHEAYKQDISIHNGGAGQAELKQHVTDKLLKLISEEQTTLATVSRVFLLGLVCVLGLLPILSLISPMFIDLGDVKGHTLIWAFGLFLLPVLVQLLILFLYIRKKDACIRVLKAYYMHDAYARLANRVEFEADDYYNKMLKLCAAYKERSKAIRKEVEFVVPDLTVKPLLPMTKFNQPLRSGKFEEDEIMPATEVEGCRIRVNYRPELISELTTKHYFLLINHFNDEIAELYQDVRVVDHHTKRLNPETQEDEMVSKEQLFEEMKMQWEEHKTVFHNKMLQAIREEMLERENPTVGEKLLQYERKTGNIHLLDTMIAYAAANGEIICDADIECSDVKINKNISILLQTSLRSAPNIQIAEYKELYKRYLFITRWRSFESFTYNRILPTEDFDQSIRDIRIYTDEQKAQAEKKKNENGRKKTEIKIIVEEAPKPAPYKPELSALILWAICPDDTSSEWFKLFDSNHFAKAYNDRQQIREIMNQED